MFRLNSIGSATLAYSVDGLTIQKQLTRFTWRVNELTGSYLGAIAGDYFRLRVVFLERLWGRGGIAVRAHADEHQPGHPGDVELRDLRVLGNVRAGGSHGLDEDSIPFTNGTFGCSRLPRSKPTRRCSARR